MFIDDHNEYSLHEIQYGSDEYRTTTNAGYENDDVSDADYVFGVLQPIFSRVKLLLFCFNFNYNHSDVNFQKRDKRR